MLLAVAVFVVDADEGTCKGEDFTKGNENRMVYLCQRWKDEACCEHYAPEGAQCKRSEELDILFHKGHCLCLLWRTRQEI